MSVLNTGILTAIKNTVDTINTNVNTLLARLTSQRATWLDRLQHITAQRMGYLDAPISGVASLTMQVVEGTLVHNDSSNTHTITAVDLSKTFPYVTALNVDRKTPADLRCRFTNTTTLEVTAGTTADTNAIINYTIYVIRSG